MNEFVDKDGNVFHKGKEQPDLNLYSSTNKSETKKKEKEIIHNKDLKLFNLLEHKKRLKAKRGK